MDEMLSAQKSSWEEKEKLSRQLEEERHNNVNAAIGQVLHVFTQAAHFTVYLSFARTSMFFVAFRDGTRRSRYAQYCHLLKYHVVIADKVVNEVKAKKMETMKGIKRLQVQKEALAKKQKQAKADYDKVQNRYLHLNVLARKDARSTRCCPCVPA